MGQIFATVYNYFAFRKGLFAIVLIAIFTILGLGINRLQLQEDITQMLPDEPRLNAINSAIQEVKFSDKILLTISNSKNLDEFEFIQKSDALFNQLITLQPSLIQEINYKLDDDQMLYYFDLFYENLPLYLDDKDYLEIDSALSKERLEESLKSSYKLLLTPAGAFIQKTLTRDPLNMTPRALRKMQSLQADDNIVAKNNRLFSNDAKHIFMVITPTYKSKESGKNAELLTKLEEIRENFVLNSQLQVHFFGAPLVSAGNAIQIKKDVNITMSLVGVVLFLFLLYFYRRPQYFLILVIPVIFGGLFGMGIMGWITPNVSSISLGIGAILLGITIDYSLHVFSHYQHVKSKESLLKEISLSLILSCITTVLAFFALQFTGSPVLHDLGLFAGLSIVGAALGSLLILPHLLPKKKIEESDTKRLDQLVKFPYHKNPIVLGSIIILSILAVFFYKTPKFEKDMDNLNYMSESMYESEQFLDSIGDVSLRSIFVISKGANLNEAIAKLERSQVFIDSLENIGLIKKESGTKELLLSKTAQKEKIDKWNLFWTAERKALVTKNLEQSAKELGFKKGAFHPFYKLLEKQFEVKEIEEFSDFYTDGPLKEFISIKADNANIFSLLKVKVEDREAVLDAFTSNDEIVVFDKKYLTDQIVKTVSSDFSKLANWSLILVFLVLLIAYGRFELAIIAFLPLGLSWFWVMGAMQIFDLKLNLINLIITSFVFGLGIDYSIFILNGLIRDQRLGTRSLVAYKGSVFLSAFTTIIAVGGMIFAGHPALKSIAIMSIVGIGSVLILVYSLVPALYSWMISSRITKGKAPLTILDICGTLLAWLMILWGFHLIIFYAIPVRLMFFLPLRWRKKSIHYLLYIWAKVYIFITFNFRRESYNLSGVDVHKQRILIANHQSFIDTVYMFSITPFTIIATNDKTYRNIIFGPICRLCDFLNVGEGFDKVDIEVKRLWAEGYSIIVFPEGTRSEDLEIHRFHKGAFKLAEDLQAEILPVLLHGAGHYLPKGNFWGTYTHLVTEFLEPISPSDKSWGQTYTERSKTIRKYMQVKLEELKDRFGMPRFLDFRLRLNYLYISPVLYWYLRSKFIIENRYELFNNELPKSGRIYDIGCGNGFLAYLLQYSSSKREIFASDFDEEKIANANSRFMKNDKIHFEAKSAQSIEPKNVDGAVFSDVLHYLNREEQISVLDKFAKNLNPGGVILIKDGDAEHVRIKGTKRSEFLSTKVSKFNKHMHEEMTYIDTAFLQDFCTRNGLKMEELELSSVTSNKVWKITHAI